MSKTTMFSTLRSKYARFISPLYSCCSCTSVNEPEEDELPNQPGAGPQVPSCQGHPEWAPMPATSTVRPAAKAEPESLGHKSSAMKEIMPSNESNDEQLQGKEPAPSPETIDNFPDATRNITSTPTPAAEPITPLELSPFGSRKLSRTSTDSQDGQAKLTASAETSGEPAAEPVQSPANNSIDGHSISSVTLTTTTNIANPVSTSKSPYGDAPSHDHHQCQEDMATAAACDSSEHGRDFNCVAGVVGGRGSSDAAEYLHMHFVPLLMQQLQLGASFQEAATAAAQLLDAHLISSNWSLTFASTRRCSDW